MYLLFSFVFFSGIIRKHFRLVALSLIIIFLYGSMIWYVLPIKEGMSWEGHLSGLLTGFLFAFMFRKKGIVKKEHRKIRHHLQYREIILYYFRNDKYH